MIFLGGIAKKILKKNLDNHSYKKCKGYFYDNKVWVAFDNERGDCWGEEFKNEAQCICWLEFNYDVEEVQELKFFKIGGLCFVYGLGILWLNYQKSIIKIKNLMPCFLPNKKIYNDW